MLKNKNLKVYVALFFSMMFWGFSYIWSKIVFEVYTPITTVFLRLIISSIFLVVIGLITRQLIKLTFRELKLMFGISILQPFLYFIGESIGLAYVSSTLASVIISTIPLFSPIAGGLFLKERVSKMNYLGIVVSVVGVIMVILQDDFAFSHSPIGLILLFMAVAVAIVYSVFVVKLSKYNAYTIITYQNIFGIFLFMPLFFIFDYSKFITIVPERETIMALVQLSIFASSFAFMLFTYGIQKLGVSKATAFSNLIPAFTAVFAYFLLGEKLSYINLLGLVLVIAGLFVSQIKTQGIVNYLAQLRKG